MGKLKSGRKKKVIDQRYIDIINAGIETKTIREIYDECVKEGLVYSPVPFRKFVVEHEVGQLFTQGMSSQQIYETLQRRRNKNKKSLADIEAIISKISADDDENGEEESVRDLVSRMHIADKHDTASFRGIDLIDIYKLMILAQRDDSVVDIPQEVLKSLKYKLKYILDSDFDMARVTSLGTLMLEGYELIVIVSNNQDSMLSKLQVVKSSRPQSDKNYDLIHIKENYFKWKLQHKYVGV